MEPVEDRVYNIWSKYAGEKNNIFHDQVSNTSTAHGRNIELESLLDVEKQRSAQYEVNIESLKNEYSKLETENVKLISQIETLCRDCENIKQVYENLLSKARFDTKSVEEKYAMKAETYKLHIRESEDKWKFLEQQLWMQIKDLESQLAGVIFAANQHAHQFYMREHEINLAKQESAAYMKGAAEHLNTKVEQIKKAAQNAVEKKNDELQTELSKTLTISKEKTSLQLHVQCLSDEVEQLSLEKRTFAHQLACVETELQKTLMEQRVIITALQGEKQLLETRLKDRTNFNEQLKREKMKLEMDISAYQTELHALSNAIQGLTSQSQAEQHRIQLQVEALQTTLIQQEDAFRKTFNTERILQEKIVRNLLLKNEQLFKANQELVELSKRSESSKDRVIEDLESKICKLEIKVKEQNAEMQSLRELLESKEIECTRLKVQIANESKTNMELRKLLLDSQQLVETCSQNEEMSRVLTQMHDQSNLQVDNLSKLLEVNQEVCENLKIQLLDEKEETRKLIEDMNKYEDMRHCKHNEEMLQLVSKVRDLKVQLKAEKDKNSTLEGQPKQASAFSDSMSVSSD
ncbi:paramyosin [Anabrus simplex]|uniref:paramyosin n=1 Tax=Anabrus simplex TaxID=316456 RepID=UPI0034DD0892